MIRTGEHLVLSLWAEAGFEAEVGPMRRGAGVVPITLAHNVRTEAEVDAILALARRIGADPVEDGGAPRLGRLHRLLRRPRRVPLGDRREPRADRGAGAPGAGPGEPHQGVPADTYAGADVLTAPRPLRSADLSRRARPRGVRRARRRGRAPRRRRSWLGPARTARPGQPEGCGGGATLERATARRSRRAAPGGDAPAARWRLPRVRRAAGSSSPTTAPPARGARRARRGRARHRILPRLERAARAVRAGRPAGAAGVRADRDDRARGRRRRRGHLQLGPSAGRRCSATSTPRTGTASLLRARPAARPRRLPPRSPDAGPGRCATPGSGLALDPEWRMGPHGVPGPADRRRSPPAEVNRVSRLAGRPHPRGTSCPRRCSCCTSSAATWSAHLAAVAATSRAGAGPARRRLRHPAARS